MLHHINFSDNLLRMLSFLVAISNKNELYSRLSIRKPNSNETEEKIFLTHLRRRGKHVQSVIGVSNPIVCGVLSLTKCSYIARFVRLITGDVRTPLLRIVPIEIRSHNYEFGANLVKHFSFPNYIALQRTNFRTIEIDIRDHLENKIPFEFGTLTVTLHFKRRQ